MEIDDIKATATGFMELYRVRGASGAYIAQYQN